MNMRVKAMVWAFMALGTVLGSPWLLASAAQIVVPYEASYPAPQVPAIHPQTEVFPVSGYQENYLPPVVAEGISNVGECGCQQCGCFQSTCVKCRGCTRGECKLREKLRRGKQCPECNCENCVLVVAPSEETKTCFKVEQKVVCIPKVRLPWQKYCPPTTSRSRVVTVLKTHSYKCPGCSYTWTDKVSETKKDVPANLAPLVATEPVNVPSVGGFRDSPTPAQTQLQYHDPMPAQPAFEVSPPIFRPRMN